MAAVIITLDEARKYLRVDSHDEDALIGGLLTSAQQICSDVARLDPAKWSIVSGEEDNDGTYTDEGLERIRGLMYGAVMYTLAYLFEHREEADHHALMLTLRAYLGPVREDVV